MLRALFASLLLLFSAAGSADTLKGFYLAGGLMNQQVKAHMLGDEGFDGSQVLIDSSSSRYRSGGTLLAGYALPLGDNAIVMLEAGADLSAVNRFRARGTSASNDPENPNIVDSNWKMSRQWFLAFKPGIRLGDKLYAYASFAWHGADVDFAAAVNFVGQSNVSRSGSQSINGTGIGLGLQGPLSERLFIRGEVESLRFSRALFDITPPGGTPDSFVSRHSIKPEAVVGRVVVGYMF